MVGFFFLSIFVEHKITNMAKAKKQTIDAEGNIVDVEIESKEAAEASMFIPELIEKKKKQVPWYEFELVENVIDNLECLKYICDEFNIKICKNNLQKIKTDEIFTHAINYTEASTLYLINLAAKKGFINSVIILRLKLN